jgi:hypothetical protein
MVRKIKLLLVIAVGTVCSCQKSQSNEVEINDRIKALNYQFVTTANEKYLDSVLIEINNSNYFEMHKLTPENTGYMSNAFLYKKNFMLFSDHLKNSTLPSKEKLYLLNIVNAYMNFAQGREVTGKYFINQNVQYLSKEMEMNSENSVINFDLLYMKSHLLSESELNEYLDSLCLKRERFCKDYNKEAIRKNIKNYVLEFKQIIK